MTLPTTFRIPRISYTNRDYASILDAELRSIPHFNPDYTDNTSTDFGVVLMQVFAMLADGLHFYADSNANENFLPTCVTQRSTNYLTRLIGYTPRKPSAAVVTVTFTATSAITITANTKLQAGTAASVAGSQNIFFETDAAVNLLPDGLGNFVGSVTATQGETYTESFTADGSNFQTYKLSRKSVLDGSLTVTVNSVTFTEVSSLADADYNDNVFQTKLGADDYLLIQFGDGDGVSQGNGAAPASGVTIDAAYRVGGGIVGNVGAGSIGTILSPVPPVSTSVTNAAAATGGADAEDILQTKILAPLSIRSLNRGVTLADYAFLAKKVSGVVKASAQTSSQTSTLINVYILASDGVVPASSALKASVLSYLQARAMVSHTLNVTDPVQVPIDINGTVVLSAHQDLANMQTTINNAVATFFSSTGTRVDVGKSFYLGDFFQDIENIPGVDHLSLTQATRRLYHTAQTGFPSNATVTLKTNQAEVNSQIWTVTMTTTTQFSVRATIAGLQVNTGTVPTTYTSDKGEVSITIVQGATPLAAGMSFTFTTSPYLGDAVLAANEIFEEGTVALSVVGS